MRYLLLTLALCVAAGCNSQPAATAAPGAKAPLTTKLQGMTPEQRTEYVKSHMDEVAASASVPKLPAKKP